LTVEVHRAGAALRDTAAELGAGHAEVFTQYPEQGSIGADIDLMPLAVDNDRNHGSLL
jgi:hypothetical protein